MATVIDVYPPNSEKRRHVSSAQNGRIEVRERADGGFDVLGVHESAEVRGQDGAIIRQARRDEEELGSYPPGTRIEYVAR